MSAFPSEVSRTTTAFFGSRGWFWLSEQHENHTWANALMALVILVAPLVTRPLATIQRLLICALGWTLLGMPGAYSFGVPVFYAGCLLGIALVARIFLVRERRPLSPPDSRQGA